MPVKPATHHCLFCNQALTHIFADLGTCPPSNAFLTEEQCGQPEVFYPLQAWICPKCLLVQGPHYMTAVDAFLQEHTEFEIDEMMDAKLMISVAPRGYLRRKA